LSNPDPINAAVAAPVTTSAAAPSEGSSSSYDFMKEWATIQDYISKEKKVAALHAIVEMEKQISDQLAKGVEDTNTQHARNIVEQMKAQQNVIDRNKYEGQEVLTLIAEAENNEGWTFGQESYGN